MQQNCCLLETVVDLVAILFFGDLGKKMLWQAYVLVHLALIVVLYGEISLVVVVFGSLYHSVNSTRMVSPCPPPCFSGCT